MSNPTGGSAAQQRETTLSGMIGRNGQWGYQTGTGIQARAATVVGCDDASQTLTIEIVDERGHASVKNNISLANSLTPGCFTPLAPLMPSAA